MRKTKKNQIVSYSGGVLTIDVSTKVHANKLMNIDVFDYFSLLDMGVVGHIFAEPKSQSYRASLYINGKKVLLHRQIIDAVMIDHADGNPLNNTRENLRPCSSRQNNINRKSCGKSKFKGVHWNKDRRMWRAMIREDGKKKHIGYYHTEIDAAWAYFTKAKTLHGEFLHKSFGQALRAASSSRS